MAEHLPGEHDQGEHGRNEATRPTFTEKLVALGERDVLKIGVLKADIVKKMTDNVRGNRTVVITGKRRNHYLREHPEMVRMESRLRDTALHPEIWSTRI